ncbi:hypothetical protein ACS2QL_30755, partial [Bacillus cereus group sp. Bce038]|uniref:hypothetical protein n=1 Tax=Bacillus cereus group sp. Bce038 TaxID=3445231 RepID=UPI003F23A86F
MKLLEIVRDSSHDVEAYDNLDKMRRYISLRNSSTVGHGSRRVSRKEVEVFVYGLVGAINMIEKSSTFREAWIVDVKN